ncbi:hypothetical protein SAMN04515647_3533 [Cohaesibacter sp. ES.047]|nr:hypothetical protein SAMN04515647_3533 [Cohaesibacter sp. ES.047]
MLTISSQRKHCLRQLEMKGAGSFVFRRSDGQVRLSSFEKTSALSAFDLIIRSGVWSADHK